MEENQQQTQLTCDVGSGNRTPAIVMGGECSHFCTIPASHVTVRWFRLSIASVAHPLLPKLYLNLITPLLKTHARKTFCQLWSKIYIFAKKHVSNFSFKTLQGICWDSLIQTPCVWPLIPRKVAALRKRKTHLLGTIAPHTFDELWFLNQHRTISSFPCIFRILTASIGITTKKF